MDGGRTTKRQYSEYSDFFLHNENQSTIKIQTPISGSPLRSDEMNEMGDANRTLVWVTHRNYRTGYTQVEDDDAWTFAQRTEQPAGRKRRVGGRPVVNRVLEETGVHRDSRWDSPRKRALFTSDGPDSTMSGSDIPEGHADRPPEILRIEKD